MADSSPLVDQIAQIRTFGDRNSFLDTAEARVGLFSDKMGDGDRGALRDCLLNGGFEATAANDVALYHYFNARIGDDFWRLTNEQKRHGVWFRWRDFSVIKDELKEIKEKINISPFMSYYLDGAVAQLTNNFESACANFREAAHLEIGPGTHCGIHTVPDYDLVWSLPDLSAPDLIEDRQFSLVFGKMPRSKGASPDLVFACDAVYFDRYFEQIIRSLSGVKGLIDPVFFDKHFAQRIGSLVGMGGSFNVFVAVHQAHRAESLPRAAEEAQRALPRANLAIISIDAQPSSVADLRAFYTAMRFYFLRYLLRQGRQRLLCYDIDIEFRDNYQWRLDRLLNDFDVGVFMNRGPRTSVPWRVINASSFAIKKSFWAEHYLDLVLSYLNHQLANLRRGWFVDQQALFWTRQFCVRSAPGVRIGDIREFGPQFKTHKLPPT